jgi:hypothetical protein
LDQGHLDGVETRYVLTVDAVRAAITELRKHEVADYFPAYLHLHALATQQGVQVGIQPGWRDFAQTFLAVSGDESGRPYFRPFREGDNLSAYWMNQNVAGSWAPSSLRRTNKVHNVLTIEDGKFNLRDDHENLAREHLLGGNRLPAEAVAGFFYRDFALSASKAPTRLDLLNLFRSDFGFPQTAAGDSAFVALFTDNAVEGMDPLFERWSGETS